MSSDDDFEPKLGKLRARGSKLSPGRQYLNSVRKATNLARGAGPQGGRYSRSSSFTGERIGRGSGVARVLSTRAGKDAFRQRRVIVKARIVKLAGKGVAAAVAHMRYIQRDGMTREGLPGKLYSARHDLADGDDFMARAAGDRHQFRFIISPEDSLQYDDLKGVTRSLMIRMENDLNTRLDWVAVDHFNTGHPHTHIMVRGRDDQGKDLIIAKAYITEGIRERAGEVISLDLGPRKDVEIDNSLKVEMTQNRFTSLDARLLKIRDEEGLVRAVHSDSFQQTLLAGRLNKLEDLGLAEKAGSATWRVSDDLEPTLRRIGERDDIYKIMAHELRRANREEALSSALVHDQDPALVTPSDAPRSIVGRVVKRGLSDELNDRQYLLVDATDGHVHYVDIGQGDRIETTSPGSVVRLTPRVPDVTKADQTIAEVAAASDGAYTVDNHLRYDRNARQTFAETHARRLEAIRRSTGAVQRTPDGRFLVGPDYLTAALRYEQKLSQVSPVKVEVLSTISLDQQLKRNAATWLDRELTSGEPLVLANAGFGTSLSQSLQTRQQWLVDQGIITMNENGRVTYPSDMIRTLTRQELATVGQEISKQNGLRFVETREGQAIEGKVRRSLDLASGKFALIEKSKEFTLVPWRDVLTRHIDKEVSGIMRESGINWTVGRQRGIEIG